MALEPIEYVRKVFTVKAVEVSYDNIYAVAEWCKGRLDEETAKILGSGEVKLPVVKFPGQGEDKGKELVARIGYFVVYSKGRFRVYKPEQFHRAFELPEPQLTEKMVAKPAQITVDPTGPQPDQEIWINPGDSTDEIAEKLGFEPADFCIDHNCTFSECNEQHMTDQPATA